MSSAPKRLALIVEGPGDKQCLPGLVKRILEAKGIPTVHFGHEPISAEGRGNLTAPYCRDRHKGIEYYVEMAIRTQNPDGVLVLVDADKSCVAPSPRVGDGLGPRLRNRATPYAGGRPVAVVVANKEYEAWLVSGWAGIAETLQTDPNPRLEGIHPNAISAKHMDEAETLSGYEGLLTGAIGTRYKKTTHQRLLTQQLQVKGNLAPQCRSFQKLVKEVLRLGSEGDKACTHSNQR